MILFVTSVFWVVIIRCLLPLTDEPDWLVKTWALLSGENLIYDKNFVGEIINSAVKCNLEDARSSLYGIIKEECLSIDLNSFYRIAVQISIFFLISIAFYFSIKYRKNHEDHSQAERLIRFSRAVLLTFSCPGFIYNSGVLSNEQFTLGISLLLMLQPSLIFRLFIYLLIISVDFGNGLLVAVIDQMHMLISKFFVGKSIKLIFLLASILALVNIFSRSIPEVLGGVAIINGLVDDKFSAIATLLDNESVGGGGIVYRVLILLASFYFLTPAGLKAPIAMSVFYISMFFMYFSYFSKLKFLAKNENQTNDSMKDVLIYSFLIVLVIMIFPNYANSKYFIFLFPYFISPLLGAISWKRIFILINATNVILVIELLFQFN